MAKANSRESHPRCPYLVVIGLHSCDIRAHKCDGIWHTWPGTVTKEKKYKHNLVCDSNENTEVKLFSMYLDKQGKNQLMKHFIDTCHLVIMSQVCEQIGDCAVTFRMVSIVYKLSSR